MKAIIFIISFMLYAAPSLAWMNMAVVSGGQVPVVAGGATYYYTNGLGASSYTTCDADAGGVALHGTITVQAGDVTELCVMVGAVTAANAKLSLWDPSTTSGSGVGTAVEFTPVASQWNCVAITPYTVTNNQVIGVASNIYSGLISRCYASGTTNFGYNTSVVYATFGESSVSWTDSSGSVIGYRAKVE